MPMYIHTLALFPEEGGRKREVKQSRVEQKRVEQIREEQSRVEQRRVEQCRVVQSKVDQIREKQSREEQIEINQVDYRMNRCFIQFVFCQMKMSGPGCCPIIAQCKGNRKRTFIKIHAFVCFENLHMVRESPAYNSIIKA